MSVSTCSLVHFFDAPRCWLKATSYVSAFSCRTCSMPMQAIVGPHILDSQNQPYIHHVCMYIYIYTFTYRDSERERERERHILTDMNLIYVDMNS